MKIIEAVAARLSVVNRAPIAQAAHVSKKLQFVFAYLDAKGTIRARATGN